MSVKPPRFSALRPTFGIGIVIGAVLIIATQVSGSDSAFGLVLGGGAGIAVGLTRRTPPTEALTEEGVDEEESGDDR